jgi:hypothetical protein
MSAAHQILDRLQRVKQSRPGQWMSACPCCESRKGRPLAVTESSDGRVLMHAFCGCTTESVLSRIGLELKDLFDQPLGSVAPVAARVPARDVLAALSTEASVIGIIGADMLDGRQINESDWQRLASAVSRVGNAIDYIEKVQ